MHCSGHKAGVVGSTVFRSDHAARRAQVGHATRPALYITELPKSVHDADERQAAMEALLLVAEHDGPTMFARIGVMRALQGHEPEAAPATRPKRAKAFRIVR